jgi:hypothetical protein
VLNVSTRPALLVNVSYGVISAGELPKRLHPAKAAGLLASGRSQIF